MEAMNYVKPELIVVAFVLYFFGVALRQAPDADSRMEKVSKQPIRHGKKTAEVVQPEIEKRILKDPVLCYTGR